MATIKDYQGKSFDVDALKSLAQQLSSVANLKGMSGGVYGTKNANVGFSAKVLEGALGEKPTVYDQVLMDAARGLLKKGVTDISQLRTENGKVYNGDKLLGRGTSIQIGETFTGEGKTSYNLNLKGGTPSFSTSGSGTGFFDSSLGKLTTAAVGVFGGPLASAALAGARTLDSGGDLGDALESGAKAGLLSWGAQKITGSLSGGDVGGVTGPDNIDIGGGWSPATGATAAELTASRAAIDAALPDNIDAGGGWSPATGATEAELSAARDALSTVPSQPITANQITEAIKADNIDVGGGYNPATGTGDVATANAAAETGVTNYVTANDITNTITGNADKKALYSNEGYGDTLTSEQINAIDKAVAGGMSVKDAIDMVRAGLLINTIAGDPLDIMGGGSGTGGTSGSTGFAQVPIPAEWKSPTYAPIAGPIDLSTILSSQNMLGGTQWQNLPSQRNVTFNDIFAAGQQQTPMGSPVDLNNIVSAILGQTATSQKPA